MQVYFGMRGYTSSASITLSKIAEATVCVANGKILAQCPGSLV